MALEPCIREAPFLERAHSEIVDQYVSLFDQTGEDFLSRRHGHVERQRALVAIDAQKIHGLAGEEGRTPSARIVASIGRLDLDHLGAHVAQHHGAQRSCQDAR